MINRYKPRKGFLSLLELLLVLGIIGILAYLAFKSYFKPVDQSTKETLAQEGIDASSYTSIVNTSRQKINQINRQTLERAKQLGIE